MSFVYIVERNPWQIKDKKQIRTWKKAIIISKDNIRCYFSSKTKITLVQRTIFFSHPVK